jgi:hypothetical protein
MSSTPVFDFSARFRGVICTVAFMAVAASACDRGNSVPGERDSTGGGPLAGTIRVSDTSAPATPGTTTPTTPRQAPSVPVPDSFPMIHYTSFAVKDRAALDSIRKRFGNRKENMDAFRAITTLNRKEFGYIRVGDTIVVPDSVVSDLRAYSVFPVRYPGADTLPKLVIVSNALQSYACYEYGHLVRFAACNTGTESKPTLPGRYSMNWKERLRISSLNDNWKLPYTWNFHLYAGNAFHQFTMPGRPVSHSCVRQFMTDAEWLFSWGQGGSFDSTGHVKQFTGTPVIIVDVFDFSRKKGGPWLELASNRDGLIKLPDNPMGVEEALIPMSQVPVSARGSVGDRQRYLTAEDTLRARGIIRPEAHLSASIDYNRLREGKARKAVKARRPRSTPKPAAAPAGAPAQ